MTMKQNLDIICLALTCLGLALTVASATEQQQQQLGCQTPISTPASAQEQMISLSKLVDPSGKLSKIINDFQASTEQPRAQTIDHPKRSAGAPDAAPVESQASNSSAVESTTPAVSATSAVPEVTPSTSTSTTTTTTTTTTTPAPTTTAAAAASPSTSTPTPVPAIATSKATEASNVTVNVFLQLVPDAKTDELINNPDSTPSSPSSPSSSPSSPQPEQPTTSAAPAAIPTTTTTVAPAAPSSTASAAPAAESTTTTTAAPVAASTEAAAKNSTVAQRRRRRRRSAEAPSGTSAATSAAPSSTAAPSTTTTSTTTTTTTTTTQASTSTSPSSTTTTTTPVPPTTAAPSSPSTTASPPSTTTAAAAAAAAPAAAATTTAAPVPAPSSVDPMMAKASSMSPSIVEISTGNSNQAQAADPGVFRIIDVPFTIEVVSSSASPAASNATSAEPSTSTTTTTTTTSTTTQTPTTPASKAAAATTPTSTTTEAPAQPSSTTAAPATSPSTTPSTTTTTTVQPSSSSSNSTDGIGMLQAKKEIVKVRQAINSSATSNKNKDDYEAEAVKLKQLIRVYQQQDTKQQQNLVEQAAAAAAIGSKSDASNYNHHKESTQTTNNIIDPTMSAIDNLNVIYDNDTSIADPPPSSTVPITIITTGKPRSPSSMGDFVNCDRPEEAERENYATCKLEPVVSSAGPTKNIPEGLMGRINFWQPINSRGILHMLVRVRYHQEQELSPTNGGGQPSSANGEQPQTGSGLGRTRRESFRLPIELVPAHTNGSEQLVPINRSQLRHTIRLADGCDSSSIGQSTGGSQLVVGEPSATLVDAQKNLVDMDAELLVAQFNLTGHNELVRKFLVLSLPDGKPVGCCQVVATEQLVSSELDNLPSVQVVQPIRDELLPTRLKASTTGKD